jgi:hypothetical protein
VYDRTTTKLIICNFKISFTYLHVTCTQTFYKTNDTASLWNSIILKKSKLDNKKYIAHYWSLQVRNEENKEASNPGSGQKKSYVCSRKK